MPEFSVVGKRIPRIDALGKVTGAAVYSADVLLPGMLHGKILRSPYAHALIKRLDTRKALGLDGVMAIITADDVPGYKKQNTLLMEQIPHLAQGKVVYKEQPVAAVAATTLQIAEKALELIKVEYEELPPIFDPLESMKPSAPLIHPDLYTNDIVNPLPAAGEKPSNIAYQLIVNKGDIEAGFKKADYVLENTYTTGVVHQGYIESITSMASVDVDGKINVWAQSQGIFAARQRLADFLDLPLARIKLHQVEIGGAFGGKNYLPVAPLCALLSIKTGKPVRMELTRDEMMKDGRPAPATINTIKMGVTKDGEIIAAYGNFIFDAGAYPEMSHSFFTTHNVFSQYRIPNVRIESADVLTNKVPVAFYRSPGITQTHFATESHIDLLARKLGMDPLQFRILNSAVEGDTMPNGEVLPKVGFKETLEKMAQHLEAKGPVTGKNRGRGVASGFWQGTSGSFGIYVHVNGDGSVNLVTGVTDISGARTTFAQIVAEELCLPIEKVNVVTGDTETAPWATMSVGSMVLYSVAAAAVKACQDVKEQLKPRAARKLSADGSQIEFKDGMFFVKGNPGKSVSFADLARSAGSFRGAGPVVGRGTTGGIPDSPTLNVHAVDVEVDTETGKVKVLSYAVSQDVGRAINPLIIEGQIQGSVVQGIGWALMENYIFDKGAMLNSSLLDYRLPTATDVPPIDILLVEVPSTAGTYGLRHAGEPPIIPAPAAIANAIHSAAGVRIQELPMTPEVVLNTIKKRK
jgi:xanthine dehydrogenase molybdenum-binding subunit